MRTAVLSTKVYLLPPGEISGTIPTICSSCYEQLRAGFAIQAASAHTLDSDPKAAEIILAPICNGGYGPCFEILRKSQFYRKHAAKVVVYSLDDNQFPALRGLYPSASRFWVRKGWALPAHYISSHIHQFLFTPEEIRNKDILFSFVGSSQTHPIRERIVNWKHPRGVIRDASIKGDQQYWWEKADTREFVDSFRDITLRSQFVICPRGISSSSIRLFEAMEAAAVPVIISDELTLPPGPNWDSFCLRVPERDVDRVPSLIEQRHEQAREMGAAARQAWKSYFSPEATVGGVVEWAKLLLVHSARRPALLLLEEYTSVSLLRSKLRFNFAHRKCLPRLCKSFNKRSPNF